MIKTYIKFLQAIKTEESINKAAKELGIPYKKAWKLLEELKNAYPDLTIVESNIGGSGGGYTILTKEGKQLLEMLKEE